MTFGNWKQKAQEAADMGRFYAQEAKGAATSKLYAMQKQAERRKYIYQAGEVVYNTYLSGGELPDELFDILRKAKEAEKAAEEAQNG